LSVHRSGIVVALPVVVLAFANVVAASELRVLSAAAVKGPLAETVAAFERETGRHVALEFATAGQVESRIVAGERVDLVVNTRPRLDALVAKTGRAGSVHDLGTVRVGVAARAGAPRPDVSTVDAFRASLLAAQSVTYTNPAAGGTAGTYFAGVLDRLGIAEAMAPKRRLAADGLDVMRKVASGEAELGITQVSEIYLTDRSMFAGALPESLQLLTTYAVFVPDAADPGAGALASELTNEAGRARFRAAGFE
jgi:molybdate transport system substrate-binding protein